MHKLVNNKIQIKTIWNIYKFVQIKITHGMECFQCPVAVPNHKKRSYIKRC
jgi:hypothetical protein